jgi:hypothetical protein
MLSVSFQRELIPLSLILVLQKLFGSENVVQLFFSLNRSKTCIFIKKFNACTFFIDAIRSMYVVKTNLKTLMKFLIHFSPYPISM